MAAEYEVNIKINSQQVTRQLGDIDKAISKISKTASNVGKPKGGSSRRKPGIAGLLPSSEELKAAERGLVQLTVKTKNLQNIAAKAKDLQGVQAKFSERRVRALSRSNTLNEKELRISQRLTSEARTRLRLLSQSGAKGFDAPRPQGRQMADDIDARLKAQEKSARLANRINELEVKGVNVAKHRKQLGKIRTAQADGLFGLAEREIRILRKSLELEQSKLRVFKEQSNAVKTRQAAGLRLMGLSGKAGRLAGRAEAIAVSEQAQLALPSAQMLGGEARGLQRIETAGELKLRFAKRIARAEQRSLEANKEALKVSKASAEAGAKRAQAAVTEAKAAQSAGISLRQLASRFTPLINRADRLSGDGAGGLLALPSTKQLAAQARGIKRIETSEERRARFAERRLRAEQRSNESNKEALKVSRQSARAAAKAARAAEDQAEAATKQLRALERTAFLNSEAGKRERGRRLGSVALGGGFPLLFGGGPGSVLGGALGGLTGSFGAQIGLSALGQQFDIVGQKALELGQALNETAPNVDKILESLGRSTDTSLDYIRTISESENKTFALREATRQLAVLVGEDGVNALNEFGQETTRLGDEFTGVMTQMLASIAKISNAVGVLSAVADGLERRRLISAANVSKDSEILRLREQLLRAPQPGIGQIFTDPAGVLTGQARSQEQIAILDKIVARQAEIEKAEQDRLNTLDEQANLLGLQNEEAIELLNTADALNEAAGAQIARDLESAEGVNKKFEDRIALLREELQTGQGLTATDIRRRDALAQIENVEGAYGEELRNNLNTNADLLNSLEAQVDAQRESTRLQRQANRAAERARNREAGKQAFNFIQKQLDEQEALGALQGQQLTTEEQLFTHLTRQLELARATTEEERVLLQLKHQLQDIDNDIFLVNNDRVKNLAAQVTQQKLANKVLEEQKRIYEDIGNSIKTGVVDSIIAAVEQTQTLGEVASNVLRDISRQLLRLGINQLFGSFGFGGGGGGSTDSFAGVPNNVLNSVIGERALGGAVGAGRPYMVGERGPELFVPGAQGNIVPNNAMGGANVTVNVDASGSSVQGDADQASQLGKAIGIAVQQELIKQKRPGGLLAR